MGILDMEAIARVVLHIVASCLLLLAVLHGLVLAILPIVRGIFHHSVVVERIAAVREEQYSGCILIRVSRRDNNQVLESVLRFCENLPLLGVCAVRKRAY